LLELDGDIVTNLPVKLKILFMLTLRLWSDLYQLFDLPIVDVIILPESKKSLQFFQLPASLVHSKEDSIFYLAPHPR
jgi:hypothetical protein